MQRNIVAVVATKEGFVDFGRYPDAALQEVAVKQILPGGVDRAAIISALRTRIMTRDGAALRLMLQELRAAAQRHGAGDDVVVLTDTHEIE